MILRLLPALILTLAFIRISPALELSGSLISSNGAPTLEKLVLLVEHHENRHADMPDTFAVRRQPDKDGRFVIELPDSKTQYMLFVTDASNRIYGGFAHLDESTNFGAIVLQSGGALTGSVQSRERKSLPDLELILEMRLRPYTCSHYVEAARGWTDAQGAFSFENLSPGEYRYRPVSDSYAARGGTLNITEDPAFLNLILDPAARLTGKITDPHGKPVPGVRVRVDTQSALSDAQGSYRLGGLTGGTNYVSVFGTGYVQDKTQAHESTQVICVPGEEISKDFTVISAGVLRLTLEPAVPNLCLPDELEIILETGTEHRSFSEEKSAPLKDRVAVFSNMAPGDYTVTLRHEDLPSVSTNITMISGQETRQVIRVPKAYRYKGRIVDEGGKPVCKVTITTRQEKKQEDSDDMDPYEMRHDGRAKETRSDDQGKFVLKGLAAGAYRISAQHDDLMPTNCVVEIAGDVDATPAPWVMLKGLKVSGAVTDAEGKPALRHRVTLNSESSREAMLAGQQPIYKNTDVGTHGAFEFKGLPPGKFRLSVTDADYNEITTLENVEAGSDDIIVTLAKTRLIKGTVVDTGGNPIQGASIQAVKSQKRGPGYAHYFSSSRKAITTDTNGQFEISVREGGSYDIIASAPPLVPQKATLDLSPGAATAATPLKLVMARGYKISGTLVTADGQPAGKGLNVGVSQGGMASMRMAMSDAGKALSAETDAQGQFALDGAPPGIITLNVSAKSGDNLQMLVSKEVLVDTNKMTDVKIVLPRMGAITGRYVPGEGKKPGIMQITLSSVAGEGRLAYNSQSDSQGVFSFTNIPAGKYMAMAFGRGGRFDTPPRTEFIEVIAGKTLDITLGQKTPGTNTMSVTGIVSRDQTPFQAGEIYFMPMPKETGSKADWMTMYSKITQGKIGSNGVFSVKNLEPGEYLCTVSPRKSGTARTPDAAEYPQTYQTTVKLAAGQTNLDIHFTGITLIGTVTGPEGKPAVRAFIQATPTNAAQTFQHMVGYHGQTDTQGQYRVDYLPPGIYDITAHHPEYGMTSRKNVTVSETSNRVDLALAGGVTLTGMVTTATGSSAEGAWILLAADDESTSGSGVVDDNGTYQLKASVPKGTYRIFIALKGHALETAQLTLTTNIHYNATLMPGGDIRVTVQKQGKPVSGKTVRIQAADGSAVIRLSGANAVYGGYYGHLGLTIAATDEQGQTMIRALKPGTYTVSLAEENASVSVNVKPLDTAEAALDLQ